jgi:hypothetical protein
MNAYDMAPFALSLGSESWSRVMFQLRLLETHREGVRADIKRLQKQADERRARDLVRAREADEKRAKELEQAKLQQAKQDQQERVVAVSDAMRTMLHVNPEGALAPFEQAAYRLFARRSPFSLAEVMVPKPEKQST